MLATATFFLLGLVLLVIGAEALVRGASRIAAAAGVSPLVIGLTIVAAGTSAPEMAVSVKAAVVGDADIALGNIVGSNIFNVLFILGVAALITPLLVHRQLVRIDVPIMVGVSLLLWALCADGAISSLDGLILIALLLGYAWLALHLGRKDQAAAAAAPDPQAPSIPVPRGPAAIAAQVLLIVVGLALLVLGARWLVQSATTVAQAMGVSQLVIGLTIVAAGTSLPEVATSIMAAVRGQRDIAVGNVVGSNIFNILAILGVSAIAAPKGIHVSPAALYFDIPVMVAVALACFPIFFTGHVIRRWEGGLFLAYYAAYTLYLVLASIQHDALSVFGSVMLAFVLPLTAVTLLICLYRAFRAGGRSAAA